MPATKQQGGTKERRSRGEKKIWRIVTWRASHVHESLLRASYTRSTRIRDMVDVDGGFKLMDGIGSLGWLADTGPAGR